MVVNIDIYAYNYSAQGLEKIVQFGVT